ncbi:DNA helicase [Bradyrhizobium symbiodeficiens]|uniref:DNA helicase n=1 Tax=Bradyrhizobium symbiodeficiens TaxID=1404367 RepID=A0A6G9AA21_9BRAD|nr:DNA helicase [Bradyrhizobium symbiodeficiens]QIP01065.1 AAA family ATPase [Bradyrhizobium symbiodeficiens]QIP09312.1 AAA family ATPase [Bradyrhizobium symbiodeficiens]
MRLSAPIYQLKRKAKRLSREEGIPLHDALDRIATTEGFSAWSMLAAKAAAVTPANRLFPQFRPGDLVLVGARPGHGKTLMSLELTVEAMRSGHRAAFFSLEYTEKDVLERIQAIGASPAQFADMFEVDCSDAISADYIVKEMAAAPRGTVVVIDYLQLLDQRRENPDLSVQVRALKSFARDKGLIVVFISQIDRSYDPAVKPCPDLDDVRLPNPLDLKLFDKTCFLNNSEFQFRAAS